MILNCLIVDDEKPARELVKQYCSELPFINVLGECKNAFETIEALSSNKVDLLFLDIKMPKLNGIELLRTLKTMPYVIITTAFRDYAVESFELDVTDYLKKPFSYERFLKAVLKVKMLIENTSAPAEESSITVINDNTDYIFIKADRAIHKITTENLQYVEAMGDYANFYCTDKKHTIYTTLKKVESILPEKYFVRIHRSYIVSIKYIDCIEGNQVFIGDKSLPIGKSYRESFLRMFG